MAGFRATAVAGSTPRGRTDDEDQELAQILLDSEKNRAEHALTAEEMIEALGPRLSHMEAEEEPRVLALAHIQHLETVISGVPEPGEDILSLVESLHPTPAVCGSPREEAQALIRAEERFDRGWYAGPVGWFDMAGEGRFCAGPSGGDRGGETLATVRGCRPRSRVRAGRGVGRDGAEVRGRAEGPEGWCR